MPGNLPKSSLKPNQKKRTARTQPKFKINPKKTTTKKSNQVVEEDELIEEKEEEKTSKQSPKKGKRGKKVGGKKSAPQKDASEEYSTLDEEDPTNSETGAQEEQPRTRVGRVVRPRDRYSPSPYARGSRGRKVTNTRKKVDK